MHVKINRKKKKTNKGCELSSQRSRSQQRETGGTSLVVGGTHSMHAMRPFGFVTDCMALIKNIMFIIHVRSYKLKCMGPQGGLLPCEIYIWPVYASPQYPLSSNLHAITTFLPFSPEKKKKPKLSRKRLLENKR